MKATICDICDQQIPRDTGGRVVDNSTVRSTYTEMDLCNLHYQSYKTMRIKWVKEVRQHSAKTRLTNNG